MKTKVKLIAVLMMTVSLIVLASLCASADSDSKTPSGNLYEFGDKNKYVIEDGCTCTDISEATFTYGLFSVSGDFADATVKDGVLAYKAKTGVFELYYTYDDLLLTEEKDALHLKEDSCKSFGGITFEDKIGKGLMLLQTSKDRDNWVTVYSQLNAFSETPRQEDSFYTMTEAQIDGGCFFRLVVAYETEIRTGSTKILFVDVDKTECCRYAEIYEFYVYNDTTEETASVINQKYSLGSKVRTEKFEGYYGEKKMTNNDAHYGWDLGDFFVSGYTGVTKDQNGDVVFLKNVGDQVTLYFNLEQNISCLNGNAKLSITADTAGSDRYFETATQDFGKGTLIIRYTDYENVVHEPVIYTNFLEANATPGSDTVIQLFEEGDYEVALDYQITEDKLIDQKTHYRIFFKYSVRNSNCMVYPFDVKTGSELTNTSITENGFYLDFAKSRYLNITIKKEVLSEGADGLVEDTRFNRSAKDGEAFTDEGIYTITASNQYTGQVVTKKIYVGTNNVLKAAVVNNLSVKDVTKMLSSGYVVDDEGTLTLISSHDTDTGDEKTDTGSKDEATGDGDKVTVEISLNLSTIVVILAVLLLGVIVVLVVVLVKKRR